MGLFSGRSKKKESSIQSRLKALHMSEVTASDDEKDSRPSSALHHIGEVDELFAEAGLFVIRNDKASIGMLQRWFKIGFNRAAQIMDQLGDVGVVGPEEGTKPRAVLMNAEEFETLLESGVFYEVERLERLRADELKKQEEWRKSAVEKTELLIQERMPERKPSLSPQNAQKIIRAGNCVVENCEYDDPLDYCEIILSRCSPLDLRIVLIDTDLHIFEIFHDYPALLMSPITSEEKVPAVLDFLNSNIQLRQKQQIESGYRRYEDFIEKQPDDKKMQPILVIVREAYGLLKNGEVLERLRKILPVCERYEVMFTLFSQQRVQLGDLKGFLSQKSAGWIQSLFNDTYAEKDDSVRIDEMTGIEFEQFCAELLERCGFTNVRLTKQSGDMGGDVLAERDQVKYVVQCKRYDSSVGISAVQEVLGSRSVYNCHVGVVLTNSYFTKSAVLLAEKNNILLWDRDELTRRATMD